jgi:hypothetical protein
MERYHDGVFTFVSRTEIIERFAPFVTIAQMASYSAASPEDCVMMMHFFSLAETPVAGNA